MTYYSRSGFHHKRAMLVYEDALSALELNADGCRVCGRAHLKAIFEIALASLPHDIDSSVNIEGGPRLVES